MVPWVYQAEINSLAMRTKGAAAATATNWVSLNPQSIGTQDLTNSAFWICLHSVYPNRNQEPYIPLLYHFRCLQPHVRSCRLLPLP